MTTTVPVRPGVGGLVAAAHPGPAVAVTTVVALLALDAGLGPTRTLLVVLAVLTGQLAIGWANDLVDAARDRTVDRADKPLVTGRTTPAAVKVALAASTVACVDLSLSLGWRSGVVHLLLGVAWGFAHDLGLKATWFSWLSYAVAFGTLPAVVTLAAPVPALPHWSTAAAAATLGVGAHVVNALPDLADDARTGVRGLPHRLGERVSRPLAAVLLVGASLLAVLGPAGAPPAWVWFVLAVVVALAVVALVGRGRLPFRAAMAIALVDVVLLVAVGP